MCERCQRGGAGLGIRRLALTVRERRGLGRFRIHRNPIAGAPVGKGFRSRSQKVLRFLRRRIEEGGGGGCPLSGLLSRRTGLRRSKTIQILHGALRSQKSRPSRINSLGVVWQLLQRRLSLARAKVLVRGICSGRRLASGQPVLWEPYPALGLRAHFFRVKLSGLNTYEAY
jgi:hypothetical protein